MRQVGKASLDKSGTWFLHNSDILVLMETKVNSNMAHKNIDNIKLSNFFQIPLKDFSGGIWRLWKNNIEFKMKILKTCAQFIHC